MTDVYVRGMSPAHDLFSQSGLWRQCYRILQVSSDGDLTTQEIAATTGVSVKTVQRSLKALTDVDLIKIDTSQRWHVVVQDLDRIANDLGVTGTQKQRKEAHNKERSKYLAGKVVDAKLINAPRNVAVGTQRPASPEKRLETTCEALNGKPASTTKTVRLGGGKKQMRIKVITTNGLSSQR